MQTSLKLLALAAALSLVLSGMARAQNSAAADLTQLEAETTLLKARARKLDVQAQIATRQAEIGRLAAPVASAGANITVRAIEGIGTPLYATLQLDNGEMVDVKAGDVLANGVKVVSVTRDTVMVQRKRGKPFRLASAIAALRQAPPALALPLPAGLPPMPPPPGSAR
ncbi:type IV pilus biogenesis protein PilP [Janthinobacterium violaceinigrum]|uniref:Type IV pilus biogenesis protein PilP n=1 Tax=Janthinobacterium violaceinigrum TaxID=2654252 RepID=A0A6I1I2Z9_9BURK|nr:type IV pilus biogenesis protein PilP [Janthinobacterium violaceinigrum]KAB8065242.1 type IV pilus biogenesis protein PilP [Janthinobacterium violaceinigrum]